MSHSHQEPSRFGHLRSVSTSLTDCAYPTTAKMFNNLPSVGPPHRVMLYDLHTLQNRFFFAGNALATLHTAFPLLIEKMQAPDCNVDCVAFPDDGAEKRFGNLFKKAFPEMELVTCAKKRDPVDPVHGKKRVVICDGDVKGKHVVIVDDMIQSGGTLYECARTLEAEGAASISAFCTHAIFPKQSWRRFARGGDRSIFKKIWLSNSNPTITSV
jgi:phosphoribosylpyrophosphate synthetase